MASHDHENEHDHEHGSDLSETQLRVRALETVLTEKGYIDPAALDAIVDYYETKVGPRNGAMVVAKAWRDAAFRQALLADATEAVATLGHVSRVGDHLVAVENTPKRHNMVVCTLCSCYPWEILGLPAGLVQVGTLSLPCSQRPTRCARRLRHHVANGHGNPRMGLNSGNALSCAADASSPGQRAGPRRNLPS